MPGIALKLFIFTLLMLALSGSQSIAQHAHTLLISNLGKKKGILHIGWYSNADDFRKPDKAVWSRSVPVNGEESVSVVFNDIKEGKYAIALFLDTNGDKKINTNILGIPRERYGFSNNVYPAFRAANFNEASFQVRGSVGSQTIRLK